MTVALRPPGEGERPVRLHLEDHGHDGIVLVADNVALRFADGEALTLADDLTILAERREKARGKARR